MRAALVLTLLGLTACDPHEADPRFRSPEATVRTMLLAYDLADVPQAEIRERMAAHGRFELLDPETFEACFADLPAGPEAEGLAGFVLGAIAAGKDELVFEADGERATVSPRDGVQIVLEREGDAWRVVLAESVPRAIRTRIASVAAHSEARLRRGLPTVER